MSTQEVIGPDEIKRMDLNELKGTSREIEADADDIEFPSMAHHMTVRGKLEALVEHGVIDYDDMERLYEQWKEGKQ